jgi:hypothetical protein
MNRRPVLSGRIPSHRTALTRLDSAIGEDPTIGEDPVTVNLASEIGQGISIDFGFIVQKSSADSSRILALLA